MRENMEINKETLLENICLLDDFSPLLYEIDRNNHANLLGKGSCATVFKAKYRVRQRGCSLTHSARTPPAVHQGITIWVDEIEFIEKIIF